MSFPYDHILPAQQLVHDLLQVGVQVVVGVQASTCCTLG